MKTSTSITVLAMAAAAAFAAAYLRLRFPLDGVLPPVHNGDAVVVTGASTGIGKHATLSLAREGYVVFAGVRRAEDGDALLRAADKFEVDPAKIRPILLDVTKRDQIANAVDTVSQFVGERGLKGLFNNAGISADYTADVFSSAAVEYMDISQYRKVFDVNFFGLVEVTKSFLELLRKGQGRVVNNSSIAGFLAGPFMSAYTSSKHAVEGFSDSLRREVQPLGVRVSVLEPGFIATPIMKGRIPEGREPYAEAERSYFKGFWKNAIGAPSPKVTSEAVIHAMRSVQPHVRYIVGKDAVLLRIFRCLPAGVIDAMVKIGRDDVISETELRHLLRDSQQEFAL